MHNLPSLLSPGVGDRWLHAHSESPALARHPPSCLLHAGSGELDSWVGDTVCSPLNRCSHVYSSTKRGRHGQIWNIPRSSEPTCVRRRRGIGLLFRGWSPSFGSTVPEALFLRAWLWFFFFFSSHAILSCLTWSAKTCQASHPAWTNREPSPENDPFHAPVQSFLQRRVHTCSHARWLDQVTFSL